MRCSPQFGAETPCVRLGWFTLDWDRFGRSGINRMGKVRFGWVRSGWVWLGALYGCVEVVLQGCSGGTQDIAYLPQRCNPLKEPVRGMWQSHPAGQSPRLERSPLMVLCPLLGRSHQCTGAPVGKGQCVPNACFYFCSLKLWALTHFVTIVMFTGLHSSSALLQQPPHRFTVTHWGQ